MPAQRVREVAAFEELDVIRTRASIVVDGRMLPSGSTGAIVLVHRDGRAFEVEFVEPVPAVLTLEIGEIEPAPWRG